jgi:hypothetical protein
MNWARLGCVLCCALTISIDRADAQSSSRSSARSQSAQAAARAERAERRAQRRAARLARQAEGRNADERDESDAQEEHEEDTEEAADDEADAREELSSRPAAPSGGAIVDPELGDVAAASASEDDSGSGAISDPELGEGAGSSGDSYGSVAAGGGSGGTGEAHLVVHSRFAADLYTADPREEIWESTTIAALDGTVRRSESLRFGFGLRMRYQLAGLEADVPDSGLQRQSLDVAPVAGYVDLMAADGLHLMIGYQTIHLGRFEVLSATNVLAVNDLRDGPATMPEATEVGQLAVRIDYDPVPGLALRAIYVPFFTPHVVSVIESDYALFRQNQADVGSSLDMLGITSINGILAANLSRGDRARIAESALAAFGPPATLSYPQGALRATYHGTLGELGLTAASALEHIPTFRVSQELIDATVDPMSEEAAVRLDMQQRPVQVEYNRFELLALDGAIDISPLSLGFEVAYMWNRTLYTLGRGAFPLNLPLPELTDMVQVGLRLEFVQGSEWLAAIEAYGAYTLSLPKDPNRDWMFFEQQRFSIGAGLAGAWSPEWGLRLELGAIVLNGPSLFLTPRVGYLLFDELEAEIGAVIVEGERPPTPVGPELAFGGLYDTVDQVYIGLRYKP